LVFPLPPLCPQLISIFPAPILFLSFFFCPVFPPLLPAWRFTSRCPFLMFPGRQSLPPRAPPRLRGHSAFGARVPPTFSGRVGSVCQARLSSFFVFFQPVRNCQPHFGCSLLAAFWSGVSPVLRASVSFSPRPYLAGGVAPPFLT